jgi:endonuclease YncB( thermonuclease family)
MGDLVPAVGRPRGAAWRALHNEGVVWEGQVLIVGEETDLATRLIVTHQRLAFARGGIVALDVEREWLRPAPTLDDDGTILLQVTVAETARPEPLRLLVTEGRRAAAHLVSLLTGAGVRPVTRALPTYLTDRDGEPFRPSLMRPRPAEPAPREEPADSFSVVSILDADDFPPLSAATSAAPATTPLPSAPEPLPTAAPPPPPIAATNGAVRAPDWSLRPIEGITPRSTRQGRRGWIIRLSGLVLLLAAAGWFGASHLPEERGRDIASHLPGVSVETPDKPTSTPAPSTTPVRTAATTPAPTATRTATTAVSVAQASKEPTLPPEETAVALGVGGPESTIEPLPEPPPTNQPPSTASPTATATTEPTATTPPTETAAPSPTATLAPTETRKATTTPPANPTDTPAPSATVAPTQASTATEQPTRTPKPTKTPKPTATSTATPTATSIVRAQEPSLSNGEIAQQVMVAGAFRYTVETAVRGVELPELALPNPGNGEWVVLVVNALNWSDANAQLTMADFRLAPAGAPDAAVALDSTTDAIASFLGLVPAFKHDDAVLFAPGEGHRLALVFLISPGLGDLTLRAGSSSLDLASSFAHPSEITDLGSAPKAPDLLEGKVTDVIDGRTIEVDVDGESVQVVYLGISVPTGDACYAAQATATNSDLVLGKTVWLEREWKNRASKGMVARDVWIDGPDGTRLLVAAELVARGAATPSPVEPDVRYAGVLSAAATAAQNAGLGFWSSCGGPPPIEPVG